MGRKKKYPVIEHLEIVDIAAEGKSIGKHEGMIVFVPQVIPGDIVDVQIKRKKKNFMEGFVVNFHKYSDKRIEPFCEHFGVCGGCKWQHLPYSEQLKYKQKQVTDSLERIGKVEIQQLLSIIPSENEIYYRNKLEYTFSENRWLTDEEVKSGAEIEDRYALGFHIPGRFDRVLDIKKCYLQDDLSNRIRLAVRDFSIKNNYRFFDQVKREGFLRNLIIRNTISGEWMVLISFFENKEEEIRALLEHLASAFPQITSLMYVINPKGNDTINDLDIILFKGREYITERFEDINFKIGPKSFFQTNSKQALKLYGVAREFAGLTGSETVYDLYTGTGTIALFVARLCRKVIGIEYVPEAIEDAKMNAVENNIKNACFYAGDIKEVLSDAFVEAHGRPDVMIIDPPRAGMIPDVVAQILKTAPARIVYVSCNPATQARDIQLMSEKYELQKVQPVDMFPHTHHVENVVLMVRKI
ncbi:MAG: 23S rRNA (uracil(1939)-C(5))-methyltransferase RlmD [Bacteroidales bacterium]|nr:23S rRNA (uracil(1939)-C(5))-methyltransferase RlmD [Bacteroidales bacterium]